MNMISTGAFLNEMDASNKQPTVAEKFAAVWEKKNAKAARAGGVSLMALSLAACGSSSTTTTTTTDTTTDTTPVTPVTPASQAFTLTSAFNNFTGGDGADTFTAATAAVLTANDTLDGGAGSDTLTISDAVSGGSFGSSTGLSGTISNIENLNITTVGSIGGSATTAAAGTKEAQAVDVTYDSSIAVTKAAVTVNGQTYEFSPSSTATTAANASTAIKSAIELAFGGAVTVAIDSTSKDLTVTADVEGVDLPAISAVTLTDASNTHSASISTTAGSVEVAATAAKQIETFAISDSGTPNAGDAYSVSVNGVKVAAYTGATHADAATAIAAQINSLVGSTVAVASGGNVTVTGGTAGVALPQIGVFVTAGSTNSPSVAHTHVQNAKTAATSEAIFDLSAKTYTDVALETAGGANLKLADTMDLTLTSTDGAITVDEGKAITIKTTGTTNATTISGDALTTVSVTGGGAAAIDNDKTIDGTLTAGAGTTMTSVTLAKVEGASTVKGKALTNLTIDGPTTAASSVTVTNTATGGHTLNLNLNGAGYEKTYKTAKTVTVTDTTATTMAVTTSGTKNSVDLGGATNNNTFTTLTMAGSGKAAVELGIATVQKIDAAASSADLTFTNVNAATKTITTGSGKDTFTTATTTAVIDSGAGNDSVTINAALTAGATVNTGAGDDTVLAGGSGSVATTTTATKAAAKVDGGDGTDVIDVQLVNSGNAAQFVNFEVLGLDGTGSFDSDILSGITGLKQLDDGGTTITNLEQTQSLESVHLGSSSATTTLTFTASTVTGKEDAYSITLNASELAGTSTPTSANATHGTVVLNGIEDISIVSDGTAKVWNAITLGANNDAETVTISGDNNLDLSFASGFGEVSTANGTTGVTLIDGSSATGKLAINITNVVEATANLTIKGGSGADTFTTIAGDTVTLDGGAGTDNYVVAANVVPTLTGSATILDALVTINALENGETIDIGGGTSTTPAALGAAQSTASATTLTAALNAINNATATTAWGKFAGDTYIVWDASGTTGNVAASDVVVKLEGTYDLSLSTIDANDILTYVEVV